MWVSERPAGAPAPIASTVLRGVVTAAVLIALGNIASRVLGMVRMSAIAYFFGRSPDVEAFAAAWTIPVTVYDLLISGAISAALVPVFSSYADQADEADQTGQSGGAAEFWQIVSGVANVALLALTGVIVLLVWQAPFVVGLLIDQARPDLVPTATLLVRTLLPAVLVMGLSGLMTAVLYARRAFLRPAFAGVVFNLGVVAGMFIFHQQLGIVSLAVGVLLGALGQVVLQGPGLHGLRYRLRFSLGHPAVRRILRLYAPVALGISFSLLGALIDRRLASGFAAALDTMQYATTLIQFPLGMIAAAVSLAVLPTLARQSASADDEAFRQTLAMGMKVVLLLVLPATAGLAALAGPITALLFEYGQFASQDTAATATALLFYLPSLPAAALDQLLIFAFYARKNTLTPNLVQGAAIGIYLLTVGLLLLVARHLGFQALIIGNAAQWIGHALIMFWLLRRDVALGGLGLAAAVVKPALASLLMALVMYGLAMFGLPSLLAALQPAGPSAVLDPGILQGAMVVCSDLAAPLGCAPPGSAVGGTVGHAVVVVGAGSIGALVYGATCAALRTEALGFFAAALRQRIGQRG